VAGSVTEAACALLQEVQAKHAVAGKQVQAIAKEQFLVGRGWRGRSQLEQGHSEYHERKQLVGQKRTDQQQQQATQAQQQVAQQQAQAQQAAQQAMHQQAAQMAQQMF
jgi:Mg-chelatase subunit ChlI